MDPLGEAAADHTDPSRQSHSPAPGFTAGPPRPPRSRLSDGTEARAIAELATFDKSALGPGRKQTQRQLEADPHKSAMSLDAARSQRRLGPRPRQRTAGATVRLTTQRCLPIMRSRVKPSAS
jgi:hypothetical protein